MNSTNNSKLNSRIPFVVLRSDKVAEENVVGLKSPLKLRMASPGALNYNSRSTYPNTTKHAALRKEKNMYVYLLKSKSNPIQKYIGSTKDLKRRLQEHNQGKSLHTSKYAPWQIITAIWFDDSIKAIQFEKYLKQGSGHAFAKRHFW